MSTATDERRWVGQRLRRVEDHRLVTGGGSFVDDLHLPDTLTLAVVRSPHASARLRAVEVQRARRAAGVVDAFDGAETAHLTHLQANAPVPDVRRPDHPPLAVGAVRYVGDEVAAVLAEERGQARDALDLVEVDYEPLPAVTDVEAALEAGAPLVHEAFGTNVVYTLAYGSAPEEVEAALGQAEHVVSLRIRNSRVAAVAIEPRAVLASYDRATDGLQVWLSCQRPFRVRDELAATLGLQPQQIRLVAPEVGGGFGSKGAVYREEVLACYLALKHRRPVRWTATRSEDQVTVMQARDQVSLVEAGFSRRGELLAIRARLRFNLGAYLQVSTALPPTRTARLICGAYRVPVARGEITSVFTHTTPTGPYRGAGRPEGVLVIERVMDVAARELGIDPLEIRRRNFVQPHEFPWKTPTGITYDSGNYERTLQEALHTADYPALRAEQERARSRGELFGIGLATFVEPAGGDGWESGRVRVEPDGTVTAATGSSAHGQGHETVFAQVIADRLPVPIAAITVLHGDTATAPEGIGTFGSRSAVLGGSAIAQAADAVLEKMRKLAGRLLEVEAADVTLEAGAFRPAGVSSRSVSFPEVAAAAYRPGELPPDMEPGLEATLRYQLAEECYANGAHLAVVAIDRDTGRCTLRDFVAVDDAGVVLNPMLVEGQVQGGVAQGIGQALLERVVYDEGGVVVTATLGDYGLARASDLPNLQVGETETPSPLNPLGVKGVGESGAIGAPPAVVNAVLDALSPHGVRHLDMPLTAERIWRALTTDH